MTDTTASASAEGSATAAETVVVIGAGQAGGQAVTSLRQEGFAGRIVLVGDEPYYPYQRPPLSKKFLAGELPEERLYIKPVAFYEAQSIETRLGVRAEAIDRTARTVRLSDGEVLAYHHLILATGSRVREIPVPGVELTGVHYLRGIDDVLALRGAFAQAKSLAVVGGGYIGLEVAAVAAKAGLAVTVIEMAPRCLARVTAPEVSDFFECVHREEGVVIRTDVGVSGFEGADGVLTGVRLATGEVVPSDLAVVGIGILPNVELAAEAGLEVDNGIVVDAYARTSDPAVFALGDCANLPSGVVGARLRLESVQNAIDQAKHAAAAIAGQPKPYDEVPWFWSDQYDLKLQIAGISAGYDQLVVRGNPEEGRSFAAFYLKDGVVIAVDAVNAVPEFMIGKKLIAARARIAPEVLADLSLGMKEIGTMVG